MSGNPLTDARAVLSGVLDNVGVPVHDQPPGSINPPCVVLLPGSPWITARGHVTLEITCYANPAGGNAAALDRLETLVVAVRESLFTAGVAAGDVDSPRPDAAAGVLVCSMPVTVRTTCR